MKKVVVLVLFLGLTGLVAYRAYDAYKAKAEAQNGPTAGNAGSGRGGFGRGGMMRMPLVDTVAVKEGILEDQVTLVGSLRPNSEVQIMSKIAGRIDNITVDVGDRVQEGQLLASVEDREILQQIEQAEASMAVASASIQQREAELANFSRQVNRYRELYEQSLISRQELEDVLTRQQTAEAQVELSKAQYRQADAGLKQLKISLENTRSISPMVGIVSKRYLHPGALVTANTPIVTLVDLRTLRMIVNVVERDIVRIGRGVSADISVDAFPKKSFTGKVLRVSPVLDPATRTGELELLVSNPNLDLRAEMFARASLDIGGQRRGILIPREALVYRGDQSGVFVLDGNTAHFRSVEPGITRQEVVEVVSGVEVGEMVVSMGASLLKDGDQVRLRGEGGQRGRAKS